MTTLMPEARIATTNKETSRTVLRLLVRNHAGVMSHVCGLFARRSFNVDGILCMPIADCQRSAVLLAVADDARIGQMMQQLRKLEDVIEVERAPAASAAFEAVGRWLR
jgi:acetolactate synthase-1/3 small subunit